MNFFRNIANLCQPCFTGYQQLCSKLIVTDLEHELVYESAFGKRKQVSQVNCRPANGRLSSGYAKGGSSI